MDTLYCPGCDRDKPKSEYHKDSSRTRGYQTYCKACHRERAAEWWKKNGKESYQKQKQSQIEWRRRNKDMYAARQRRYHLKRKYGLLATDYDSMLLAQDGKCACCGDSGIELVVDHCHQGGRVRSLLCQPCNKGIGCFNDDPIRLEKAIAYLKKHSGG